MNVDKVGGIGPLYEPKKTSKTSNITSTNRNVDKIEISEEYRIQSLKKYVMDVAKSEEIESERLEKINQIKENLNKNYLDKLTNDIYFQIGKRILLNSKESLESVKPVKQEKMQK